MIFSTNIPRFLKDKNFWFLYFFIFLLITLVFALLLPRHSAGYYYDIIRNQESVMSGTVMTEEDKSALLGCETDECYRKYFDEYTMGNGVARAFSLLALYQKEFPERIRGCHYISHGIGHASLRLHNNDFVATFDVLESSQYYKNIATCGNGYFHGVVEEFVKDAHDELSLAQLLRQTCEGHGSASCYHGAGHAATLQLADDIPGAIRVCNAITDKESNRFECHTGIFMQQSSLASVTVENGIMNFAMCDKQTQPYQTACYLEQSSLYERYTKNPEDYVRNMGFCKQIADPINRMACVKLFAIRSVRIGYFEDVRGMCKNTSTKEERVMCTAVTAWKLAKSIDQKSPEYDYSKIVWDICSTILTPLARIQCYDLVMNRPNQLFYTSVADLTIPSISRRILKSVYNVHSR